MPNNPRPPSSRLVILWRDKWLISAAFILLWLVRLALWLLGYNRMTRRLTLAAHRPAPPARLALRVAESIRLASRLTVRPTCLVQAVAAKWLLVLRGYSAQVHIGVRKGNGAFEAHAWLVSDNRIVLGGDWESLSSYRPLMEL
jgi:Transglutaminase-like superfamily